MDDGTRAAEEVPTVGVARVTGTPAVSGFGGVRARLATLDAAFNADTELIEKLPISSVGFMRSAGMTIERLIHPRWWERSGSQPPPITHAMPTELGVT